MSVGSANNDVLAVDGVRALCSLSLVALHTALLASTLMPFTTPFTKSAPYVFAAGGGCQVDVLLLLSGFLTARRLMQGSKDTLAQSLLRRAARLWPALVVLVAAQQVLGDDQTPNRLHIPQILMFVNNLFDVRVYGTLTCTVAWSVCVDMHVTAVIHAVWHMCRAQTRTATAAFLLLFGASFAVRFALQDPNRYSLIRLGDHVHMGSTLTRSCLRWLKQTYNLSVDVGVPSQNNLDVAYAGVSDIADSAHAYLNRLYFPSHARFGPAMLGAALALGTARSPQLTSKHYDAPSRRRGILCWVLRLLALLLQFACFGVIVGVLVPPPSDGPPPPPEAHAGVTTALRNTFALASGVLLVSAEAPPCSAMYNPLTRGILRWRVWRVVSKASYMLNMCHFRIIMELAFRDQWPLRSRLVAVAARGNAWPVVLELYLGALLVSLMVAHFFHAFVEPASRRALERVLMLSASSTAMKEKKAQ